MHAQQVFADVAARDQAFWLQEQPAVALSAKAGMYERQRVIT